MIERDLGKIARATLKGASQTELPTDLQRVLAYLRIHHERPWHLSEDAWASLGRPQSRGRTRFKNQETSTTPRQRWRLAHEIAHHVLHSAVPHRRDATWETHELEYEADLFAAELLMPETWVKKTLKRDEKAHQHLDIDSLASEFGVGSREMEKRLRQLELLQGEVLGRM
jgi:predicted transcriptional regulator